MQHQCPKATIQVLNNSTNNLHLFNKHTKNNQCNHPHHCSPSPTQNKPQPSSINSTNISTLVQPPSIPTSKPLKIKTKQQIIQTIDWNRSNIHIKLHQIVHKSTKMSFSKKSNDYKCATNTVNDISIHHTSPFLSISIDSSYNPTLYNTLQQMSGLPKEKQQDQEPIVPQQHSPAQQPTLTVTYGQTPISMKCPFCLQHIHSEIILKPQFISIAVGISIFVIVPHLLMMILVITLMHFTASRKHRCPLCQRELGHDGKFLLVFTDQVYSLSLFSAGFIFTKKMVVTAVLIAFTVFVLSIRVGQINRDRQIKTTWAEYLNECGSGNNANQCLEKYRSKLFQNWQGYLLRLQDNRESVNKYYLHALSMYMKMQPKLNQDNSPDILLTLSSEIVYGNSEVLRKLVHGNLIKFNCTLHERYRGNIKDVMHFHIQSLQIIGHNPNYALFTTEVQEEWIQVHVENRGRLTSEPTSEVNSPT